MNCASVGLLELHVDACALAGLFGFIQRFMPESGLLPFACPALVAGVGVIGVVVSATVFAAVTGRGAGVEVDVEDCVDAGIFTDTLLCPIMAPPAFFATKVIVCAPLVFELHLLTSTDVSL